MKLTTLIFLLLNGGSLIFCQETALQQNTTSTQEAYGIYGLLTESSAGVNFPTTNAPLIYADVAVYLKGKLTTGTQTDLDGKYFIPLMLGERYIIVFRYLGFIQKRIGPITIDGLMELNVSLKYAPMAPCAAHYPEYNFFGDGFSTGQTLTSRFIRHSAIR